MEKIQIFQVLNCNKTINKMLQQQSTFPISVGFKLYDIMKKFDEVEEYVFHLMDITFNKIDWNRYILPKKSKELG